MTEGDLVHSVPSQSDCESMPPANMTNSKQINKNTDNRLTFSSTPQHGDHYKALMPVVTSR